MIHDAAVLVLGFIGGTAGWSAGKLIQWCCGYRPTWLTRKTWAQELGAIALYGVLGYVGALLAQWLGWS